MHIVEVLLLHLEVEQNRLHQTRKAMQFWQYGIKPVWCFRGRRVLLISNSHYVTLALTGSAIKGPLLGKVEAEQFKKTKRSGERVRPSQQHPHNHPEEKGNMQVCL